MAEPPPVQPPPGGADADGQAGVMERIAALEAERDAAQATATRQQIEAEQALHDLTQQLADAQRQIELERQFKAAEQQALAQARERVAALEQQVEAQQTRHQDANSVDEQHKKHAEQLEREKRELLDAYERSETDKRALDDALKSSKATCTALQAAQSTLEANLQEATATSRSSLLRIQTLQSTVTSLEADKAFLTEELERGRAEWSTFRREKHEELVRVQSQLDTAQIEARSAKSTLEALKTAHEQLQARFNDTLQTLSTTREQLEANEGNFASEMNSMKRFVEMMEKRETERKHRIEEIERSLEEERAALAQRETALQDELQAERDRYDALDQRYAEMREVLDRRAALMPRDDVEASPSPIGSSFALSPSAQMAVRGQRGGRSYAEVYSEYIRMEEELIKERAETKRLSDCLAQILGDIEERAPLLKEQRLEYERLTVEATQLASQLTRALSDRDQSEQRAQASRLDVERLEQENAIFGRQLSDLGRQVRTLLRSLAAAQGLVDTSNGDADAFDEEEAAILRRAELDASTDSIVSAHLVTFSTINELQVQNQKLLRITREMGAQLEKGEEDAISKRRDLENKAVEEAHELILRLKEEVESQRAKSDAFERERDMFRRMLAQRKSVGGELGDEIDEGRRVGGSDIEAPRLLADVQANFDAYKAEIAIDSARLREDLKEAQHAASQARTDLAKSRAQAEYTAERLRLLQQSFDLQNSELTQVNKRAAQLQDNLARQEMTAHKLSEELLQVRGTADQLRHENTNLKSEREVGRSIEKRLSEENAALSKERSHLADLMSNLQTMQNELERAGSESRRRLEEQVMRLEAQATDLRDRLSQETDANRQLSLRREVETRTLQERIEKLTAEHAETRESLVGARTAQEHLQQRVADLLLQITAKEEKLAIYEGRSGDTTGQTAEQQLEVTVADLRTELRSVKSELERATANVEQYKSIAEAEGSALTELTATYDEYKSTTDASIAEKESELKSLRERLHSLTADVTAQGNQNSELHRQIEQERVAFEKERKMLEDGMASLRAAEQTAKQAQLAAQDDLRRQVQLAQDAHDKYDRELVAHAEDVKRLGEVKAELDKVRQSMGEYQAQTEVAKANLLSSEESWNRQKQALEQELSDVRKRCDDLTKQNSLLHEHLETFNARAAQIQARQPAEGSTGDTDPAEAIAAAQESSSDQLRQVIKYLRGEKDIVDFQLELAKQEAARLRTQLEFTSRNLDEARRSLSEERAKSGEAASLSAQHAELLERIHTAKLLRESNQTLRDENESQLRKIGQLETRLRETTAELEPLKEQVQTLRAEVEAKDHNIKLLEEDNERWKTRNQTILAKYERIDPEELQVLKTEVEGLKAQLAEKEAAAAQLQTDLEAQTKLAESMRENWNSSQGRFKGLQTVARATRDEKNALQIEVNELKAKLEQTATADSNTSAQTSELESRLAALQTEKESLEAKIKDFEANLETRVQEQAAALQAQLEEQSRAQSALQEQSSKRDEELQAQLTTKEAERAKLAARGAALFADNKRMKSAMEQHPVAIQKLTDEHAEAVKKLNEQIDELKKGVASDNSAAIEEIVQSRLAAIEKPGDAEIETAVKARVAELETKLASERESAIAQAVAAATAPLNDELAKLRQQLVDAGTAASSSDSEALDKLKAEFEASKKKMEDEFEAVKTRLAEQAKEREAEFTAKLTKEVTKAKAEAAAAVPANSDQTPDVDALVKAKLDAAEAERAEVQRKAIEEAVAAAVKEQEDVSAAKVAESKKNMEKEAAMRTNLLSARIKKLENQLKEAKGESTSNTPAGSGPNTPRASGEPTSQGNAPAIVTSTNGGPAPTPASQGPGRGGAAAGRGRGGAGRGGAARGGGGGGGGAARLAVKGGADSSPQIQTGAPAPAAGPPSLSLKGSASANPGQRQPGGVLGGLLSKTLQAAAPGASAPKRAREEDGQAGAAGQTGGADKRFKPGQLPKGGSGGAA
ncbi:Protein mlp1 [Microbotryomycetes sp. JL201]|nr:Protein mlp1 [Microbotryomycetes sp. JL201]